MWETGHKPRSVTCAARMAEPKWAVFAGAPRANMTLADRAHSSGSENEENTMASTWARIGIRRRLSAAASSFRSYPSAILSQPFIRTQYHACVRVIPNRLCIASHTSELLSTLDARWPGRSTLDRYAKLWPRNVVLSDVRAKSTNVNTKSVGCRTNKISARSKVCRTGHVDRGMEWEHGIGTLFTQDARRSRLSQRPPTVSSHLNPAGAGRQYGAMSDAEKAADQPISEYTSAVTQFDTSFVQEIHATQDLSTAEPHTAHSFTGVDSMSGVASAPASTLGSPTMLASPLTGFSNLHIGQPEARPRRSAARLKRNAAITRPRAASAASDSPRHVLRTSHASNVAASSDNDAFSTTSEQAVDMTRDTPSLISSLELADQGSPVSRAASLRSTQARQSPTILLHRGDHAEFDEHRARLPGTSSAPHQGRSMPPSQRSVSSPMPLRRAQVADDKVAHSLVSYSPSPPTPERPLWSLPDDAQQDSAHNEHIGMSRSNSTASAYSDDPAGAESRKAELPESDVPPSNEAPATSPSSAPAVPTDPWLQTPKSPLLQDTLRDMFDSFASALTDLGMDTKEPIRGLDDVSVSYHNAPYQGGSHGLPSHPSTLESMLPPDPPKLAAKPASTLMPAEPNTPLTRTPSTKSDVPPVPEHRLDVYGYNIWWPHAFDITSNLNYDSVSTGQRARLFGDAMIDLMTRPTHLDVWIQQIKSQRPNQADVLTRQVQQQQLEELEATLSPRLDDPKQTPNELPLPSNIPYPLLAKAQSAAHADPGISLARVSPRKGASSSIMQSSTAFLMNQLERGRDLLTPNTAPSPTPPRQRTPTLAAPSTSHASPNASSVMHRSLSARTLGAASTSGSVPMGLGIVQRSASQAPPDPAFSAALTRVRDALPDINDATARHYLTKSQGDDVRAINDYMAEHASRHDATQRRGIFSRATRTR